MANVQPSVQNEIPKGLLGKPNQIIPSSQKTKEWYHQNAEYYIRNSWTMTSSGGANDHAILELYEVYNNKFPLQWFGHLTNPLNSKKDQHKRFPAKIRPINILRTSIDLLINELSQRPFSIQVVNTGEKAFNDFEEQLTQQMRQNLTQHFAAQIQQIAAEEGVPGIAPPEEEEIPMPQTIKDRFHGSYKDNQAIRGQRWLNKTLDQQRFFRKRNLMMKDYLISGFAYSYKNIENGKLEYDRVSSLELKYAKSPNTIFVKDAAWAVRRFYMTTADVVERFYASLTEEEIKKIYARTNYSMALPFNGQMFYNFLKDNVNAAKDLVPIYHVTWRGKKAVKILSYPDPVTGMMEQMEVDEDYPVDKAAGESATTQWRDEVYECYRILEDLYCEEGPTVVQNGHLPYNGRAFSDTHAENISVMQIGMPFQLMVMIINWTIERMIAKSKGKIMLIDINAIPDHGDWDEEKFFYYSEAMGYMLMDRDKRKVDKSWNQYQVLDMSMYDQIKQLIDLQNHYRQMWDDVLGITMPRKGQTYASSSPTNNERSLFQSNIITDNIFTTFEEFIMEDLNDLLAYSKVLNSEGTRDLYTSDLLDTLLIDLDPADYCNALLEVMVKTSAKEQRRLDEVKAYMQEMLQNGVKPSTMMEILLTENVAELRAKLKSIEEMQAKMDEQLAENEHEAAKAADERKMVFAEFQNGLDMLLIDKEWDRKDQNTMIKGEYDIVSFTKSEDNNGDGVADANAIADRVMDRFKTISAERTKLAEMDQKERHHRDDMQIRREEMANKLAEQHIKGKYALKNKTSGESKKKK